MASEGHIIQDERINNPWLGEEESGVGGGGDGGVGGHCIMRRPGIAAWHLVSPR